MNSKQLMLRDGAPAALFLTPAVRAKAWEGVPLRSIPLFQAAPKDESNETKAFRAQEEERRRLKSLASIGRMKARFAAKAIDRNKMRWDARRNKWVPLEGTPQKVLSDAVLIQQGIASGYTPSKVREWVKDATKTCAAIGRQKDVDPIWFRVNKDTARRLAELNGVWDDKYVKLSGGLLVMTVTNRLKGLVKKGGEVKWN